ncbi:MAG TPA: 4,5-dihydroxyphthalate decarboxylase [Caldimonas sp.]|nr:4,5-dihydroxyphthalate decarboxylase [Caldimonas sp.]
MELVQHAGTASLHLTLAMCDYAHTREIAQGIVRADGITLNPLVFPSIEEITYRFTRELEWDVSELSFGKYIALASGERPAPMIAIPVFPSRMHRLSAIYVRRGAGLRTPKDLEGRAVGIPEWAQTAGMYVRGFLAEEYGVDLRKVRWVQAGVDEAGRAEKVALKLPEGLGVEARPQATLSGMLESGELDAAITARAPVAFGNGQAVRLFENPRAEEAQLFERSGVFPIMHVVVVKRSVYEQHPWVAVNLLKAFEEAKQRCLRLVADFTCSRLPLPWAASFVDETLRKYGPDPYPYGVAPNRRTLEAFIRFAHAQGITRRRMEVEQLFARESLGAVKV